MNRIYNLTAKIVLLLFAGATLFNCSSAPEKMSSGSDIDAKVDSLLALMTLEEKVGQLNLYNGTWEFTGPVPADDNSVKKSENIKNGKVGAMLNVLTAEGTREAQKMAVENSRLGIPLMFCYDVIHGYKTMMPIPLAQAASWDPEVAKLSSQVAAREAAASGLHLTFAPVVDVARDARWGRIMEGGGEDPYLTSRMAEAWIHGFQGDDLSATHTLAACAKHFAAYGFAEAGKDYNSVEIGMQSLYNMVLPPFKAASDAGVASFMNGFHDLNGTPVTASKFLQRDILKGEWGFEGFVVTDWASIGEMMTHGLAADSAHAADIAIRAGSDLDMESKVYENDLQRLVEEGKVDEALVDEAVARILKVKFRLGLFDDPYKYSDEEREKAELLSPANLEAARDAARKSIVLMKNDNDILPLAKNSKIAVIGSLAESKDVPLGSWRGQAVPNSAISLLEGIQEASEGSVDFSTGYRLTEGNRQFIYELTIVEGDQSGFADALRAARSSEVVVMAMGEDCFQSGEGRSQTDIGLKGDQLDLLNEIYKVNKNIVVVLMNGRPLAIPEVIEKAAAIVEVWHLGSEAGNAIADVIFGDYNPSGKLPVSFPYHTGQEPLYYNHKNTGRPTTNEHDSGMVFWSHYTDSPNEAALPFGHGLSYSKFEYSDLEVEAKEGGVEVLITVYNSSDIDGIETVQVYIWDKVASETQPVRRLVDFEKVSIKGGDSANLTFTLDAEDMGFFTSQGDFVTEDGEFVVFVGGSSVETLEKSVQVKF